MGSDCYYSSQYLLFLCLLIKNVNIKIRKTIILSVAFFHCEVLSLTLREDCLGKGCCGECFN
jgi:hypothetical protein